MKTENTYKLHANERFEVINLLPREANALNFKLINDTKLKLSFSEEEYAEFEVTQERGNIRWNKSKEKVFELGATVVKWVSDALIELDKAEKLNEATFSLYRKFVQK